MSHGEKSAHALVDFPVLIFVFCRNAARRFHTTKTAKKRNKEKKEKYCALFRLRRQDEGGGFNGLPNDFYVVLIAVYLFSFCESMLCSLFFFHSFRQFGLFLVNDMQTPFDGMMREVDSMDFRMTFMSFL